MHMSQPEIVERRVLVNGEIQVVRLRTVSVLEAKETAKAREEARRREAIEAEAGDGA